MIDRPGFSGALRFTTSLSSTEVEALGKKPIEVLEAETASGRIRLEETSDWQTWRRVALGTVVRNWIASSGGASRELWGPIRGPQIGCEALGFRDRWLERRAKSWEPSIKSPFGSAVDQMRLPGGRVLRYARREVGGDGATHLVAPSGAVRVDERGTARFLIKNPVLNSGGTVLWK